VDGGLEQLQRFAKEVLSRIAAGLGSERTVASGRQAGEGDCGIGTVGPSEEVMNVRGSGGSHRRRDCSAKEPAWLGWLVRLNVTLCAQTP
jgi:hypothetical protein